MSLVLDTCALIWWSLDPDQLSLPAQKACEQIEKDKNGLVASISIWEIAIKSSLGREDFKADSRLIRRGLIDNGYQEIAISSEHAAGVQALPLVHKDPFDRLLIAQSLSEGMPLVTVDPLLSQYPGMIQQV